MALSGSSDWLFPSPVRSRSGLDSGMQPIGPTSLNHALAKVLKTSGTVSEKHYIRYRYEKEKLAALEQWQARFEAITGQPVVS